MANEYSWITFLKKCWEFLTWIFSFLRGRKEQQNNQTNTELQNSYDNIDKDKNSKKDDNIENRLNDMFKP